MLIKKLFRKTIFLAVVKQRAMLDPKLQEELLIILPTFLLRSSMHKIDYAVTMPTGSVIL